MINLLDGSWYQTSLLEVVGQTEHGECLTSSSLPIAQNCTVVSTNDGLDDWNRTYIIDIILSGVMKDVVKLELPVIKGVVDNLIFLFNMDIKYLQSQ